jgi:hypothetical protein
MSQSRPSLVRRGPASLPPARVWMVMRCYCSIGESASAAGFFLSAISDHHALNLVEAHLVAPSVIELGGARRGVVRNAGCFFERAAVLEIGGNARRAKAVIADLGRDAGGQGAHRRIIA